ncbi:MAG: ATPase [Hyphomicrobiales bacterium]|nr:ATPase [Hyphomicrobiales bacterium]
MTPTSVLDLYYDLVASGDLECDPAQEAALEELDALARRLHDYKLPGKPNALKRLFGRKPDTPPIRGLYIWGSVGRGKTMLMDLFFEAAPVARKRRVHFHAFMADVHARIHAYRQKLKAGEVKGEDPLAPVAQDLARKAALLCFDEFAVTDIADAMILGRLFTALFAQGVVVVATSNVVPDRLYENGLNRALFVPFIDLLQERMEVLELQSRTDFRLEKLSNEPVYHVPADADAKRRIDRMFKKLTGLDHGRPGFVEVLGRKVKVPERAGGVARFRFADLCEQPLGATDYLELAQAFHTLIVEEIPVMDEAKRNEAKRFINLIDALYDRHVKLIASAAAEPTELYRARSGHEAFQFDRTASRLIEMRSTEYLALPHGAATSESSGGSSGLVET